MICLALMTEQLSLFSVERGVNSEACEGHRKTCPKCGEGFVVPDGNHRAKPYCYGCLSSYNKILNGLKKEHPKPTDHACDCCGKSEDDLTVSYSKTGTPISVWRLDHCHETGQFRGWLCANCNIGLGKFYDDPDLLTKAIQYIQKNRP